MNIKMIPRKCAHPLCDQVFKASTSDLITKFHARFCQEDYEAKVKKGFIFENDARFYVAAKTKEKKCLDMVNSEKMEESGIVAGELQSNQKEEEKSNVKESEAQKSYKQEEIEKRNNLQIQKLEKESLSEIEKDTTQTKSEKTPTELSAEEETRNGPMNTKELTTQNTSQLSSPELMKTDSRGNHSEESNHLSMALKEEKDSSIKTLNESSKLLLELAKSMTVNTLDEEGKPIKKPSITEIDQVSKLLDGARNIQKTKLDFLKFAKDLQKDAR